MRINAGIHKGRRLVVPKGNTVRPTFTKLKQSLFNICNQSVQDASFLDLFAGAGGMGLEALSRGARFATFVEQERAAVAAIRENIATLKEEEHTHVLSIDVFTALERLNKMKKSYDIIFADPPYGTQEKSLSDQVLKFIDAHDLLKKEGELFLEDAIEAYDETIPLTTLRLKSERKMGRALLRQYIKI
jgi:16S rRNA (guanine966-N2)-methyltransferase